MVVLVLLKEKLLSVFVLIILFVILFVMLLVFFRGELFFVIVLVFFVDMLVVGSFINICSVKVGYLEFKCV